MVRSRRECVDELLAASGLAASGSLEVDVQALARRAKIDYVDVEETVEELLSRLEDNMEEETKEERTPVRRRSSYFFEESSFFEEGSFFSRSFESLLEPQNETQKDRLDSPATLDCRENSQESLSDDGSLTDFSALNERFNEAIADASTTLGEREKNLTTSSLDNEDGAAAEGKKKHERRHHVLLALSLVFNVLVVIVYFYSLFLSRHHHHQDYYPFFPPRRLVH